MSHRIATRLTALATVIAFATQSFAQAPASNEEELKPKLIWGILFNAAVNYVATAFIKYLFGKLTEKLTPDSLAAMVLNSKSAAIVPLASVVPPGQPLRSASASPSLLVDAPTAPLQVVNGRENFQAVHVALLDFDRAGNALGFRPLSSGFTTGERFKLRVLPTFDGLLVIDNINPRSERKQIYPARAEDVVRIRAGVEILIPLDPNQYFEFAGATGDEQLVVTIRDPRAFGAAASPAPSFRQDESNGTHLMQEVAPDTYPVIAQALRLRHAAAR